MDKQRKLDKLSKLAGLLLDNTITPTQAKQLVELLVNLNTKQKEDMVKTFGEMSDSFTQEAYTKLQEAVSMVSQKHSDALLEVRQLTNKQRKEHEDRISELQTLLTEIKSIEVKDGENGKDAEVDYEKIIGSVLEQIPENVVETPEQVAGKLNTLEEVIDQKVIKGLTKKITDLSSNIAHSAVSKGAKLYTGTSETRVREIIAETPVSNSGGGTWGSSIPKFMWTTDFSSTTRFNKQASGGTNTFNADGLTIDTSAGASSWAITRFDLGASWGGGSTFPVGSPSFSTRFYIVPIGSDVMMTFGIGQFITDIAGGTQTCTSEHIGFKITRTSSGTINLSATQADGSTENTTVLTTVASADELELIAQVNGSSSVDYYWRKNGGALSSATNLTSNMPTSAEAWICWGIQNNAVATQSTIYVFNGSFQR